jgi:hypothetical protein
MDIVADMERERQLVEGIRSIDDQPGVGKSFLTTCSLHLDADIQLRSRNARAPRANR